MKAVIVVLALAALAACGKKGNPERPGAAAPAQQRTVIGRTESTEAPAASSRKPAKRDRRFILDGLL